MTGEERMQGRRYVSMGVKEEGELRPRSTWVGLDYNETINMRLSMTDICTNSSDHAVARKDVARCPLSPAKPSGEVVRSAWTFRANSSAYHIRRIRWRHPPQGAGKTSTCGDGFDSIWLAGWHRTRCRVWRMVPLG